MQLKFSKRLLFNKSVFCYADLIYKKEIPCSSWDNVDTVQPKVYDEDLSLFVQYLEHQDYPNDSIHKITVLLSLLNETACDLNLVHEAIFNITSNQHLQYVTKMLIRTNKISALNETHNGQFAKCLDLFSDYCKENILTKCQREYDSEENVDFNTSAEDLISTFKTVLQKHYSNGFNSSNLLHKRRLIKLCGEVTEDVPFIEHNLCDLLKSICLSLNGWFYPVFKDDLHQLDSFLCNLLINNPVIYAEELFRKENDFLSSIKIVSLEVLQIAIEKTSVIKDDQFVLYANPDLPPLSSIIIEETGDGITDSIKILCEKLPYVTEKAIRQELKKELFSTFDGGQRYLITDRIDFEDDNLDKTISRISATIDEVGYCTVGTLEIETYCDKYPQIPKYLLSQLFCDKYLSNKYARKWSIIYPKDRQLSFESILEAFLENNSTVTIDELTAFETETMGNYHKRSLYYASANMVRVNQTTFVRPDLIQFDVDTIDRLIDSYIPDIGVMPISAIPSFLQFPEIHNTPWNDFLLESYCRNYSFKYRFSSFAPIIGKNKEHMRNVGAIVDKTIDRDYVDLLSYVVAHEDLELSSSSIANYLFDQGYIGRKDKVVDIILSKAIYERSMLDV